MTLDPNEDRRLTDDERNAAVALLERLIPKVEQDESRSEKQSSLGSSSVERKRNSGNQRSSTRGYSGRSGGYGRSFGPWTMGSGGWGMNRNFGFGGGASGLGNSFNGGGNSFIASNTLRSGFFSGSGLENANTNKGDLGSTASLNSENVKKSTVNDPAPGSEPLTDSTPDSLSSDRPETKPSGGRPGKDKPGSPAGPSSPDILGGGVDTSSGGDSPKPGVPAGPMLIPPVPKPGF
jgi:hypothetical protein